MGISYLPPHLAYEEPIEVTSLPCAECQRETPVDEMAHLAGTDICERCLDPKQRAFDLVGSIIDQLEATIAVKTKEIKNLRYELRMERNRRGA